MLALQFMASAIATLIGYGGASGAGIDEPDPQAALGSLISFSALMLLFVFDFHHEIIKALVLSYELAPVSALFNPQSALVDITDTISESFMVVIRLGSPFIAYAILVNLAIGFVNKLTPQIPVYFISLPFVIAGGLILLYFGIPTLLSLFADGFVDVTLGVAMTTRKQRLKKLVGVQQQLKELHEMRRAGHLRGRPRPPKATPRNCAERFDAEDSLSALFPDIYHRASTGRWSARRRTSSSPSDEAGACRRGDRPRQHGRTRLSRRQPAGRARPRRPRAARPDRPRQAEAARYLSAEAERQVRLRQAFPGILAASELYGAAFLAISPPSDIVLDVARAAEPRGWKRRAPSWPAAPGRPASRPRRGLLAGRHAQFAARAARSGRGRSTSPETYASSRRWCCRPSCSR